MESQGTVLHITLSLTKKKLSLQRRKVVDTSLTEWPGVTSSVTETGTGTPKVRASRVPRVTEEYSRSQCSTGISPEEIIRHI